MKDIEGKIKDKLLEHQSLKDLDVDNLWSNISSELQEENHALKEKVNSDKKRFNKSISTLLVLTFAILSTFILYQNQITKLSQKSTFEKQSPNEISKDQGEIKTYQDFQASEINNKTIGDTRLVNSSDAVVDNEASSKLSRLDHKNSEFNNSEVRHNSSESVNNIPETISVNIVDLAYSLDTEKYSKSKNQWSKNHSTSSKTLGVYKKHISAAEDSISIDKNTMINSFVENSTQNPIPGSILNNLELSSTSYPSRFNNSNITAPLESMKPLEAYLPIDDEPEFDNSVLTSAKSSSNKFYVGVFAGKHLVKNLFASNQELNDAFKVQLGSNFSLEFGMKLNSTISVSSGIEYQKSETQFNHVSRFDTLAIYPNFSTTEMINHIATRTVKHKNLTESISIPLSVKIQKPIGRWNLGTSIGLAYNILQSQVGRSLDELQNVVQYPSSENDPLPIMSAYFSYHIKPYVSYHIKPNLQIQLQSDFQYLDYGFSSLYNQKTAALLYGLNAGILVDL